MNENNANIFLLSKQSDGQSTQTTEFIAKGTFHMTDDKFYLSYEDRDDSGKSSLTAIEVCGQRQAIIRRTGEFSSDMIIEANKKHFCRYETPFGDFTMGISGVTIKNSLDECGGELKINYTLDINTSFLGDFEINIKVQV